MGLFSRGPQFCAVCKKELGHRHKPKREWNIKGRLCGDCHFEKSRDYYEGKVRQECAACKKVFKVTDLWEPRWQWDMDGLLCKGCFDAKEEEHGRRRSYCSSCGAKMGFVRYNPKPKWKMEGQLCRRCWDSKKAEMG
ncbi:MAG: hypothetical protein MPI95_03405 [Nitrosopumilus sp.]|nr:hypothetical protein [Nitrosopumilus sp.]CAI9831406.1 conserved hypothetical protein [Nitrosopumilaceae archaeon]MDA7940860.1 hypothetical protein [Nitrosopumilus sp.]MDA7943284.1 hypothetical protein [Nitrosopumilus sp.]MDA7944223.1 hypothetical protein [Nitrosopumilus sp.]